MAGWEMNNAARPHRVYRAGGTNVWLLEYTVSGAGWVKTEGAVTGLLCGDFLLYKPLALQDYGMDQDRGSWEHMWFCFFPRPHWHELLNWPQLADGVFRFRPPVSWPGKEMMTRLELGLKHSRGTMPRRLDLVLNVIEEVLLTCDVWNPAGRSGVFDERIRRTLDYMCGNSAKHMPLTQLAKLASLSLSRFSHLFKEQVGETPLQYLEHRRVERAKELLQMTGRTVSQIAYECGFESPFYFSRVFKRNTGLSPKQFRLNRAPGS